MLARSVTRLVQTNKLSVLPKRNVLYQFSPPKNKLSNGELAVMGVVLVFGTLAPSFYMAIRMPHYNGKAKAEN
ncbi:hypothetical protein BpHYR1_000250 [Brachionus plicatilis]|uniref:Uncharacterized protein n=1 Tax=Brachionus plicatilis TaxID=10195 RepID=A0A3M7R7J5_BRAPC|nr:hypothetical protein BpHYR1_000250 [Brachionus plicatilis]